MIFLILTLLSSSFINCTPILGVLANPFAPVFTTIQPSNRQITSLAATAQTANYKKVNYVTGNCFDRVYIIFLENTNFAKSIDEPSFRRLREKGITLTNYWALTHTSEPNYIGAVGGDFYGLDNDGFVRLPRNIFSIVDLLEYRNISWAEYQEDMPYTGYEGYEYMNQEEDANDYVRKHNPLIMYDSVVDDPNRLANIKNFSEFYKDLYSYALPQWAFITCNMTNDGHDSTIEQAGSWSLRFVEPLLRNEYFFRRTLVVLTFDEVDSDPKNRVLTILLGDIPYELQNTKDDTYYDHYSLLSSVEANWNLPNLGRGDCGANVFDLIAKRVGYKNKFVDTTLKFNAVSPPGWLAESFISIPPPDFKGQGAGGPLLPKIREVWGEGERR